jgi:hypothetical protein
MVRVSWIGNIFMLVHFKAPPWWQQSKWPVHLILDKQGRCHGDVKMGSVWTVNLCKIPSQYYTMGATRFWNKKK